jgi:hypothetical protein
MLLTYNTAVTGDLQQFTYQHSVNTGLSVYVTV